VMIVGVCDAFKESPSVSGLLHETSASAFADGLRENDIVGRGLGTSTFLGVPDGVGGVESEVAV